MRPEARLGKGRQGKGEKMCCWAGHPVAAASGRRMRGAGASQRPAAVGVDAEAGNMHGAVLAGLVRNRALALVRQLEPC